MVTCIIAKIDLPMPFACFCSISFSLEYPGRRPTQTVSEATKDIAESEDRAVCSICLAKMKSSFFFVLW